MRALLPLLLCVGCSAPVADYSGQFVPVIAVACGVATVGVDAAPVTPADECQTCNGKGRLPIRDTGRFEDCPDCDANPPLTSLSPPPPAEPQDAGQDAPAVEWLDWETASQLSSVTTRPVLVFQHSGKPIEFTAETMAELAQLGILCSDTAKRWQPQAKKPIAPAVAYVAHDAALGSEPPFLSDLKTDSESATLKQLKAWINAIETP
jgi:hypothetical protein